MYPNGVIDVAMECKELNNKELKKLTEDQKNKSHVVRIQETWLKPQLDFKLQGYKSLRRRMSGIGAGVATFVKEGIQFRTVEIGNESEVWSEDQKLRIINYYNQCERLSSGVLEEIRGENIHRLIWHGDINGHYIKRYIMGKWEK